MYNKIILAGNLTKDIEIRYTPGGSPIGSTSIATSRKFKGQDGTQKEEVLFIDITFFGRTAEVANQYLRKGSKILVDGRLKLDQWTATDGTKRSKHSVTVENLQMLGGKEEAAPMGGNGYGAGAAEDGPTSGYGGQGSYQEPRAGSPKVNMDEDNFQKQKDAPADMSIPNKGFEEFELNEDEIPF